MDSKRVGTGLAEARSTLGLCGSCRFRIEQGSRRGSVFHRCARADSDPTFARYPALPVLRCRGYAPLEDEPPA